jgi:hypothetical protein
MISARIWIDFFSAGPSTFQVFQRGAAQRFVQRRFVGRQVHFQRDLGARRQLGQHLRLGAAQDERMDQAAQTLARTQFGAVVLRLSIGAAKRRLNCSMLPNRPD